MPWLRSTRRIFALCIFPSWGLIPLNTDNRRSRSSMRRVADFALPVFHLRLLPHFYLLSTPRKYSLSRPAFLPPPFPDRARSSHRLLAVLRPVRPDRILQRTGFR